MEMRGGGGSREPFRVAPVAWSLAAGVSRCRGGLVAPLRLCRCGLLYDYMFNVNVEFRGGNVRVNGAPGRCGGSHLGCGVRRHAWRARISNRRLFGSFCALKLCRDVKCDFLYI